MSRPRDVYLVQSVETQTLFVCAEDTVIGRYDTSPSLSGAGMGENPFTMPPGIHRIKEKIGSGPSPGRIVLAWGETGVRQDRKSTDDTPMVTLILRLEGVEEGINTGAAVHPYEGSISFNGASRGDRGGAPFFRGGPVSGNADAGGLFDVIGEGTIVYIDPPAIMIGGSPCKNVHFTGIFGTGMSALAQYLRFEGIDVSGSDRLLGSEDTAPMRHLLEGLGCVIVEQDGSGVNGETDALCVSTAIEETNPDIAAARAFGLPIVHRSDVLAAIIGLKRTIAVAGTSGKSTVTAMIFEFLTACGKSPSLISGAPLRRLEKQGLIGNAWKGGSDLLVVEADESDGTLVKYRPAVSVVLNISKDHKDIDEIRGLFETLVSKSRWSALNGDDPIVASLPGSATFGRTRPASWQPDGEELLPTSVKLFRKGVEYHLPLPGGHNLENLRAALCVCEYLGCDGPTLAGAVRNFEGVARRFTVTETAQNVCVVDDFAHNPAKIAAAVIAARGLSDRIIAVYQPHGFGPTRFLRDEYIKTFRAVFGEGDSLYLLPIYYAGGTARKDISSEDIIRGLGPVPFRAEAVGDRSELLARLKDDARQGDCVLFMGARDPSLPALVRKAVELFGGERSP